MAFEYRVYVAQETSKPEGNEILLVDSINNVLLLEETGPRAAGRSIKSRGFLHLVHKLGKGEEFRIIDDFISQFQSRDELMSAPVYRTIESYDLNSSELDKFRAFAQKKVRDCEAGIQNIEEAFLPRERYAEKARLIADWEAAIVENEKRNAISESKPVPKLNDELVKYLRRK